MIQTIKLKDRDINLNPKEEENIFEADSFNLIIGNNAAGKTYFLRKVADAISSYKFSNEFCTIKTEQTYEKDEVAAVYFSSIPFQVSLPSNSSKFQNASVLSPRKANKTINLEHFLNLSFILNFKTRPLGLIEVNKDETYEAIIDTLLESNRSFSKTQLKIPNEFQELINELFQIIYFRDDSDHSRLDEETLEELNDKESGIREKLNTNLNNAFLTLYPPEILIPLLASFNEQLSKPKVNKTYVLEFVRLFLFESIKIGGELPKDVQKLIAAFENNFQKRKYLVNAFSSSIQNGLSSSSKLVWEINDQEKLEILNSKEFKNSIELVWENLSSGQLALINQFSAIEDKIDLLYERHRKKSIVVLIDEGDIFLHLQWQKKYVELLNTYIKNLKSKYIRLELHILLSTHSPILLTDFPNDVVIRIGENLQDNKISSFAAPIQNIVNDSFQESTIGEFSKKILVNLVNKIKSGNSLSSKDEYIISKIDDPVIIREIQRIITTYSNKD